MRWASNRYAIYVFDYGAPTGLRRQWLTRNECQPSFPRTATPTKRDSGTPGSIQKYWAEPTRKTEK